MSKKLIVGGFALTLIGVMIFTVNNMKSNPILQADTKLVGLVIETIGILLTCIGFGNILSKCLSPD